LLLFTLPLLVVGFAAGKGVFAELQSAITTRDWQPVAVHVNYVELSEVKRRKRLSFRADFSYSYMFNAIQYTSNVISLADGANALVDIQADNKWVEQLRAAVDSQAPLPGFVNPRDPQQAALKRDIRWGLICVQMLFVALFGGVGFSLLIGVLASVLGYELSWHSPHISRRRST
jgi:hypothetical protein